MTYLGRVAHAPYTSNVRRYLAAPLLERAQAAGLGLSFDVRTSGPSYHRITRLICHGIHPSFGKNGLWSEPGETADVFVLRCLGEVER